MDPEDDTHIFELQDQEEEYQKKLEYNKIQFRKVQRKLKFEREMNKLSWNKLDVEQKYFFFFHHFIFYILHQDDGDQNLIPSRKWSKIGWTIIWEDIEKDTKKIIKVLETLKVQNQQMSSLLADLIKCEEADLVKVKKDEKKILLLKIEEDRNFLRGLQNDILKMENQIKAYKKE